MFLSNQFGSFRRTTGNWLGDKNVGHFAPAWNTSKAEHFPATYYAATVSDLIADITAANTEGGSNTIILTAPSTSPYVLTAIDNVTDGPTGLPVIAPSNDLTIVGNGGTIERSTAPSTPSFRLLDVAGGASLTLQNLTLQNGVAEGVSGSWSASGGGIYNLGNLILSGATVKNNQAWGGTDSLYNGNGEAAFGGGIASYGELTLRDSTRIENNFAYGGAADASGAFIYAWGGQAYGGGVLVGGGTANLTGATLTGNGAYGGYCFGWIEYDTWNEGGSAFGGGLFVAGAAVEISGSAVSNNAAQGGGSLVSDGAVAHGGSAFGGGIYAGGGNLTLRHDVVQGNSASGGSGSDSSLDGYGRGGGLSAGYGVFMDNFTESDTTSNWATIDPNIAFEYTHVDVLSISDVSIPEGNSGTTAFVFTVNLSTPNEQTVTVDYATADGSATAGSDYQACSGTLTFAPGETSRTITVLVSGDVLNEFTELFTVTLNNPTNASIQAGQATGTIAADDPEPSVTISDVSVTEGNSGTVNAIFTVQLAAACNTPVIFNYETADQTARAGSDYQAASGTVTFAPGELTRTITVLVNGDTLGELNETFLLNFSTIYDHVPLGQAVGTIVLDEPAFVWLDPWVYNAWSYDAWSYGNPPDGGRGEVDVGATGAAGDVGTASAAAFAYAQAWGSANRWDGSSYWLTAVNFQRTFQLVGSPTGWNVTIDGLLSGTLYARSEYAPSTYSNVSARVEIVRADTGTVTHDLNFDFYSCTATGGSRTVTVSAPGNRGGVITDGIYTVTGRLETNATGYRAEWVGSGLSYSSCGLDTTIDAVVWDNRPEISISDATFVEGNSGAATRYFTVALSNPSTQTVTVDFALADGSATLAGNDYGYLNANRTVTFAPGVTQQTIAVRIYGDRNPESNETFSVNLSNATNGRIKDGQAVGTIQDDEPRISISDVTKKEGKQGQTTQFVFTVTLSAAYDQAVTMSFATVNGTATTSDNDYIAKTGTLTFAPGQTSKTITIEVNGDSKKESDQTFYLDLFGNSSNSLLVDGRGVGTILNDD